MQGKGPVIRYSHHYAKFPPGFKLGDRVRVVSVSKSRFEDLSEEYKEKDTRYTDKQGSIQHYQLPKSGPCLIIAQEPVLAPHTRFETVRSWSKEKAEYYSRLVGSTIGTEYAGE